MDEANQPLPTISQAEKDALAFFAEHAFPAVEASADDLVTVKMTSRFEVAHVTIREASYGSMDCEAVGHAVRKAVNEAIRKVAEANAKRLSGLAAGASDGY